MTGKMRIMARMLLNIVSASTPAASVPMNPASHPPTTGPKSTSLAQSVPHTPTVLMER